MGNGQSCTVEYQANMHVVIVGGGYAGCYLAVNLLKSNFCKVTLIDPRDAMYHNLGAVRAVVDEDFMNNMFLPFSEMLGNSFLRGTVVGMDSNQNTLTLKSGYQVNYTHLVIATGQQSPFPYKLSGEFAELSADKALNLLNDYRHELANSERIALIGGTYNSVELAGEIKSAYPDKEVIVITEEDHLVTKRGRPVMQKNLNDLLTQKGISVAYGESVCNLDEITTNKRNDGQVLRTKLGSTIVADFVVTSLGEKLNNEFYEKVLASSLTPDGALEVNEH
uniref:Ferroptosis suppressor protein 1 n=1 Tax=Ciona savignyi TaxID=51511 RepID=H2ZA77_CIOSA